MKLKTIIQIHSALNALAQFAFDGKATLGILRAKRITAPIVEDWQSAQNAMIKRHGGESATSISTETNPVEYAAFIDEATPLLEAEHEADIKKLSFSSLTSSGKVSVGVLELLEPILDEDEPK